MQNVSHILTKSFPINEPFPLHRLIVKLLFNISQLALFIKDAQALRVQWREEVLKLISYEL